MHSSRMHTACSSGRPGGSPPGTPSGADPPGPDPPWDQTTPQDQAPPEQTAPGPGTPLPPGPGTPPLLTESQMPVKTLPCPNFVAGGNWSDCLQKNYYK